MRATIFKIGIWLGYIIVQAVFYFLWDHWAHPGDFENRIPLKPALGGVCSHANYSVAYEETQSNRVSDFRDFLCSLFPKAILFDFYFTLLQLVFCRVAAVKSLPVHHLSAGYIYIYFFFLWDPLTILFDFYALRNRLFMPILVLKVKGNNCRFSAIFPRATTLWLPDCFLAKQASLKWVPLCWWHGKGAPAEEKMQKGVDQVSDSCDKYPSTLNGKNLLQLGADSLLLV